MGTKDLPPVEDAPSGELRASLFTFPRSPHLPFASFSFLSLPNLILGLSLSFSQPSLPHRLLYPNSPPPSTDARRARSNSSSSSSNSQRRELELAAMNLESDSELNTSRFVQDVFVAPSFPPSTESIQQSELELTLILLLALCFFRVPPYDPPSSFFSLNSISPSRNRRRPTLSSFEPRRSWIV